MKLLEGRTVVKKNAFICLSFALSLLVPDRSHAAPLTPTTILVNGAPVETASFIQNGRTMVPSRFFEHTGAAVNWNNQYKSVSLKRNGMAITFASGKRIADYFVKETGKWQRDYLAVPTVNKNGKTYIPLRYAIQKLGMKVSYNPNSKQVTIQYPTSSSRSTYSKQASDITWLYRITEAEAGGESHQGKVAVASTILNRVKSPGWPKTITEVIFQENQFWPVASKKIYSVTPSSDTIKAVQEALKGNDPSQGATLFYNPDLSKSEWIRSRTVTATIGNHVFAK